MNLFDVMDGTGLDAQAHPKLLPLQESLLERGRIPYLNGAKRVIWQAPCGAGKTIVASEQTRRAREKDRDVLHIVHRRRLVKQMIWTLERFGIDAAPIMDGEETWASHVYCASRDTLLAMLKNGRSLPKADLLVIDECHVSATEVLDWYLCNQPNAHWTGYTATPVKASGASMNPPWQALVCMCQAREMIAAGRLCPVKVYNPDAVGQRRRRGEKVKPVGDPIDHWRKYASGMPTIAYCATVAESKKIVERYNAAGIAAEHIDAATPDDEREAIFERSRTGNTVVIGNCGVLIEGIDLPWIVCVQILRGCNSLVLWMQGPGRAMRAFPGKSHGIILDHSGAAHEFGLPDGDFQWSLDDADANARKNKPAKDRGVVACMACGFVFAGKDRCPQCGRVLAKKFRKSALDLLQPGDGLLTEFIGDQHQAAQREGFEKLWRKWLHIGRAKGWTMGRVAGVFAKEAKRPPWQANLESALPRGKDEWQTPVSEWMAMQRQGA